MTSICMNNIIALIPKGVAMVICVAAKTTGTLKINKLIVA